MAKCDHNFLQHHFLKLDLTPLGGARTLNLSMWGTPGSLANQTSLLPKVKVEDATFSLSIGQSNFKWNRTTSIATHSSACERIELSSCSMLTTKVEPSEVFVFRYSIFRLIPAASAGCNRCQPGPGGPPPRRVWEAFEHLQFDCQEWQYVSLLHGQGLRQRRQAWESWCLNPMNGVDVRSFFVSAFGKLTF